MLKRIVERVVRWALDNSRTTGNTLTVGASDSLLQGMPLGMVVHPISNGYIMRVEHHDPARMDNSITLTYAKDEQGIAEEIIAAQARLKLDVGPKQGELFPTTAQNLGAHTTAMPTITPTHKGN